MTRSYRTIIQKSSIFNNYFTDYVGFTSIPKGNFSPKFTTPDIKLHGSENPQHHVRNFISAITLKTIDKDIFYIVSCWRFDKDVMRWYNIFEC